MQDTATGQARFTVVNVTFHHPVSLCCREVEKPEKTVQLAVPQTNHVHNNKNSIQSEGVRRPDREEPQDNGIEVRFGLEVQGKAVPPVTEERHERLSPDSAVGPSHKSSHQTVLQVTLPPEQNGNVVYKRGFVPRTDTEKHVQRKTTLAQVEHWVKVQKGDQQKRSVCSHSHFE